MSKEFLDISVINKMRETVNDSTIFYMAKELKDKWNLICVVMDRLDSSVKYLNSISDYPESEEMFINFLTFACMIKDAVIRLYTEIGIQYPYCEDNAYFKSIYEKNNYPEENSFYKARLNPPSDDKFFEYFRALTFAHPFKTDRHIKNGLMEEGEVQYAPWVIANKAISKLRGGDDDVGVCVYSNKYEDSLHLVFSFKLLKAYIKSRYELVNQVTIWCKNEIDKYKKIWSQIKIDRNQPPVNILNEVRNILKERYCHVYEIDEAIEYLSCELTDESNKKSVELYRGYLIKSLDSLCDAIDDIDDVIINIANFEKLLIVGLNKHIKCVNTIYQKYFLILQILKIQNILL